MLALSSSASLVGSISINICDLEPFKYNVRVLNSVNLFRNMKNISATEKIQRTILSTTKVEIEKSNVRRIYTSLVVGY